MTITSPHSDRVEFAMRRVQFQFDERSRMSLEKLEKQGAIMPPSLPIIDVIDIGECPDFDSDCGTMSLDTVIACRDYEYPKLTGVCVELQRRQCGK